MAKGRKLALLGGLLVWLTLSPPVLSADYAEFNLINAVFNDGGTATGGFNFNSAIAGAPLPQFYNIQVSTSAGSILPGSSFRSSGICYDQHKYPLCAPGDNFLMYLETGTPGQPGYDHFQFAAFFAPNALVGKIGVLDPNFSYETGYTQNGWFTRYIAAGAIRFGSQ